jgi:hypothetical protein
VGVGAGGTVGALEGVPVGWKGTTELIVPAPVFPVARLTIATMMTAMIPSRIRHTKDMSSLSVAIRLKRVRE